MNLFLRMNSLSFLLNKKMRQSKFVGMGHIFQLIHAAVSCIYSMVLKFFSLGRLHPIVNTSYMLFNCHVFLSLHLYRIVEFL